MDSKKRITIIICFDWLEEKKHMKVDIPNHYFNLCVLFLHRVEYRLDLPGPTLSRPDRSWMSDFARSGEFVSGPLPLAPQARSHWPPGWPPASCCPAALPDSHRCHSSRPCWAATYWGARQLCDRALGHSGTRQAATVHCSSGIC